MFLIKFLRQTAKKIRRIRRKGVKIAYDDKDVKHVEDE